MRSKPRPPAKLKISDAVKMYEYYNRTYFYDSLPKRVEFKISRANGGHGECSHLVDSNGAHLYYQIEFNKHTWQCGRRIVAIILLHEMLHLATGMGEGHNEKFQINKARILRMGAYNELL